MRSIRLRIRFLLENLAQPLAMRHDAIVIEKSDEELLAMVLRSQADRISGRQIKEIA